MSGHTPDPPTHSASTDSGVDCCPAGADHSQCEFARQVRFDEREKLTERLLEAVAAYGTTSELTQLKAAALKAVWEESSTTHACTPDCGHTRMLTAAQQHPVFVRAGSNTSTHLSGAPRCACEGN